jgi:hypothetical protein
MVDVRFGSMLLKNDFGGARAKHRFKIESDGATSIQESRPLDSIVARRLLQPDFFNSIDRCCRKSPWCG